MNPIRLFLLATVTLANLWSSNSWSEQSNTASRQAVGFNAGWVVGNGLSYRYYLGKQWLQLTFAGTVDRDNEEAYIDLSLSYARYLNTFHLSENNPIGLKWVSGIEGVFDEFEGVRDNRVNIGTGFGVDFGKVSASGFVYSLDLIYTAEFVGLRRFEFNSLNLRPTVGIHYQF